jgi:hypothetical protein
MVVPPVGSAYLDVPDFDDDLERKRRYSFCIRDRWNDRAPPFGGRVGYHGLDGFRKIGSQVHLKGLSIFENPRFSSIQVREPKQFVALTFLSFGLPELSVDYPVSIGVNEKRGLIYGYTIVPKAHPPRRPKTSFS